MIVATVCARGGSTGVPGKNIKMLCDKPLIAHTIEQALSCSIIDEVYVSTDCNEIADVAKQFGAQVPFIRPASLATSEAGKIPVIQHLSDHLLSIGLDHETIIDLDPTSPLRERSDIEACANILDESCDVVLTGCSSSKNPYFNMIEEKEDGYFGLVIPGHSSVVSRQAAPPMYDMNGSVYVWHRKSLKKGLWGGKAKFYNMPPERSVDIDSELDFKLVEMLMRERANK